MNEPLSPGSEIDEEQLILSLEAWAGAVELAFTAAKADGSWGLAEESSEWAGRLLTSLGIHTQRVA